MNSVTNRVGNITELRMVEWRDLILVVDNGKAPASDYLSVARKVSQRAHAYPNGRGLLVVLPPLTTPPEPAVRNAIRDAYVLVGPQLRAVAWIIEGKEFRAAAVRAAVAGLRLLLRLPFSSMVASSYEEAVPFVLSKIEQRTRQSSEVAAIISTLKRELDTVTLDQRVAVG
jgi:hypothetical protein